jgi:hypothetical protein
MGLFSRKRDEVAEVIDLREPETVPKPRWGAPLPCPECSGRGYLDHIDPFRQVMFMHCTQCSSKYEVARTDLDFVDDTAPAFTL